MLYVSKKCNLWYLPFLINSYCNVPMISKVNKDKNIEAHIYEHESISHC